MISTCLRTAKLSVASMRPMRRRSARPGCGHSFSGGDVEEVIFVIIDDEPFHLGRVQAAVHPQSRTFAALADAVAAITAMVAGERARRAA
jgi:hypothetical protein